MFDYFYGQSGEMFSYFRVPKILFRDIKFKDLSTDAKTLYGILLDRMGLSVKNGWLDERTRLEAYFMQSLEVDLLLRACPDEEDFCRLRAAYIRAFASCKGMIY